MNQSKGLIYGARGDTTPAKATRKRATRKLKRSEEPEAQRQTGEDIPETLPESGERDADGEAGGDI